jgi:hypothetical protein
MLTVTRVDNAHDRLIYARSRHHDTEQVYLATAHPHHKRHHAQIFNLPGSSTVQCLWHTKINSDVAFKDTD